MSVLPPEHGARFELAREALTPSGARYVVTVVDASASYRAESTLDAARVDTRWSPEPPPWIAETTHGFLKTLQKNHASDASWPARLVRWREEREKEKR
jgi:hypothetical protein